MSRPAKLKPVIRSEGQRMLLCVTGSLQAIGEMIGKQPTVIHRWRQGEKIPSPASRALLHEAFGIPVSAWSRLPRTEQSATAAPVLVPIDEPAAIEPRSSMPSTSDQCLEILAIIRRERSSQDLTSQERLKLIDSEARILALRQRFEAAAELTEDRYVREHPAWQRLQRVIINALEPHPIALKAVADAIAAAIGSSPT